MDVLENILERISETEEQREVYIRQAEAEEQKIAKLEQMYYLLEDPTTQELMKDVVVGLAVQSGVPVPDGNKGEAGEKHYVGMQRVREYVAAMTATPSSPFTMCSSRASSTFPPIEDPAPGIREAAQSQHQFGVDLDGQGRRHRSGETGTRARRDSLPQAGRQIAIMRDYEEKVLQACLAALSRRVPGGLLISYLEIGRELADGTMPAVICDGDVKAARIYVPEGS